MDKTAIEIRELFGELLKAIPPRKLALQAYNLNEISLFIDAKVREEKRSKEK